MESFEQSALIAIDNVSKWGDTDIFAYPLENTVIGDMKSEVVAQLNAIHAKFDESLQNQPIWSETGMTLVGYTGLRAGTTIDPIWNLYLLALCIGLRKTIEAERNVLSDSVVHSYRILKDSSDGRLFQDGGYSRFLEQTRSHSEDHSYVLITDIADFYPRIYHHKIENALKQLKDFGDYPGRIMKILGILSGNVSYGLPVGGNASRILSELSLHTVDRLMTSAGFKFCRYSDDYRIFVNSEDAGYSAMIQLAEFLANEGLVLQKSKTQLVRSNELQARIDSVPGGEESDDPEINETDSERARRTFFGLSLRYDPYAQNAEQNYEELKSTIKQIDLLGMLGDEIQKSRVNIPFARRLIRALKLVDESAQSAAALLMLDNMQILAPVIPTVLITLKDLMSGLPAQSRDSICARIREMIENDFYVFQLNVNVSYAVRVLAEHQIPENEQSLVSIFQRSQTDFVKRDIILIMAKWRHNPWISIRKNEFAGMSLPERRAFLAASYILGDEGSHWRQSVRSNLSDFEKTVRDWAKARKASDANWEVPI